MRRILLMGFCLCALAACVVAPQQTQNATLALTDHALADRIWDVRGERFIDTAQLLEKVVQSEYLLLGETHDNPVHHRYQADMIDALAARRRSAVVAFEMIDDKQGALLAGRKFDSVDALITTLNQAKTTWDYARFYRGVFDSALKAGFGIVPASLAREDIMAVARQGGQQLPAGTQALVEAVTLGAQQEAESRREIESSHCGMLPESMVSAMMFTQRVKDAVMADRLLAHPDVDTRVLVAGSGHTRRDRGVPLYLSHQAADANMLSIAWAEVVPGADIATAYAEHWGGERLPFDYVWFTPRIERPDPCEGFRQHLHKKQQSKAAESEATQ